MVASRAMVLIASLGIAGGACDLGSPSSVNPPPVHRAQLDTPNPSPSIEASSTPSPAPTPTQSPYRGGPPDRCHTSQLMVAFASAEGAAGHIIDTFRLSNAADRPCFVYGFPGMQMLDASGNPLTTVVVRNGGFFAGQAGPAKFTLQPGSSASFLAAWSDVPHGNESRCPQAVQLEITPPDEFDHLTLPVTWAMAPCGGGEIDVTPVRAAT